MRSSSSSSGSCVPDRHDRVSAPPLARAAHAELAEIVGPEHAVVDADARAAYEVDWTGRFRGSTPLVLRPADTAQVAAIVRACRLHGVAIVPQGGNTGLVAGG